MTRMVRKQNSKIFSIKQNLNVGKNFIDNLLLQPGAKENKRKNNEQYQLQKQQQQQR